MDKISKWHEFSESFHIHDETKGAKVVLEWSFQHFHEDKIIYASSFGAEAIVLIDIISQVKPDASIVFLDTGLHFPEKYSIIAPEKQNVPAYAGFKERTP